MNKIFGIVLAAFFAVGMIGTASASGLYVTGNVADTHVKGENAFSGDSVTGGGVGVGMNIIPNFLAVEATYDHLMNKDNVRIQSAAVWAVIDPTITTVAGMPLKATARAGYAYTDVSDGANFSDADPAYGVGLALGVSSNMDVVANYTRRTNFSSEDVNLDTASIGVKVGF